MYSSCSSCISVWIGKEITIEEVSDLVDGCPACILTILRHLDGIVCYEQNMNFDFKEECKKLFDKRNEEERKREEYYSHYYE